MSERQIEPPINEISVKEKDEISDEQPADNHDKDRIRTIYSKEINKFELLTRDEEKNLAERIQKGDREALELLVNSNLRLVTKLAHQLTRDKTIITDLIQEGNIGLMKAVEKFDPNKGVKFSTYATKWIFAYMKIYIRDNQSLIKLGTTQTQRKIFSNLRKIECKLESEGLEANDEMVAERMKTEKSKIIPKDIEEMRQRLKPILSIDAPISSDEENTNNLGNYLKTESLSPEEATQKNEIINYVREAIDSITDERERKILKERLLGDKSLKQLGDEFGISGEGVRLMEVKIKQKLAKILAKKGITDYE